MIRCLVAAIILLFTTPVFGTMDVFDRIDIDRNGKIDKQEFRGAVEKIFDKLDTNKDGYLDREEFRALKIPDADRIFDKLDKDGEGRIPREKFVLQSMERFYKMDENGDGVIDKREYRRAAARLFDRLDKNKDGYLDRDEFRALGLPDADKVFDRLDSNKDGRLSKDEFVRGAVKDIEFFDKSQPAYPDKHELDLRAGSESLPKDAPAVRPFFIFYF
ncbi:MAG TPA: EF-hand domain-containing protein [Syntrophales bacterium]|nr:EF-hand domain-containing protein [Syntrophales bacterium]